jgi:hypothetical protein
LLVETPEVQLEPGLIYDIYAIGQSEDGTLQLVVLAAEVGIQAGTVAAATPVATPMAGPAGEATPAATPTS